MPGGRKSAVHSGLKTKSRLFLISKGTACFFLGLDHSNRCHYLPLCRHHRALQARSKFREL